MSIFRLAIKNITRSLYRSTAIFLAAGLIAWGVFSFSIIFQGIRESLQLSLSRLGADFMIIPWGGVTNFEEMKGVRLMSAATKNWMPIDMTERLLEIDGIARVSPQLYIQGFELLDLTPTYYTHLVAIDPATDFTLNPWMVNSWSQALDFNDAFIGSDVYAQIGDTLDIPGYKLNVVNKLEHTSTPADSSIFISYETAINFVQETKHDIGYDIRFMPDRATAIMVRVEQGRSVKDVYRSVLQNVNRARPLNSPDLFIAERDQMVGLIRTGVGLLVLMVILSMLFVGLVFTIAVNERRQEIGVLKALGFHRDAIIRSLITEGAVLAFIGGLAGVIVAGLIISTFGNSIATVLGMSFRTPSVLTLLVFVSGGLLLALLSIIIATLIPAWRITKQDAALIMQD